MKRSFGAVDPRNDRIGWRLHANRGNTRISDRKDSEAEESNMWSGKKLKMYRIIISQRTEADTRLALQEIQAIERLCFSKHREPAIRV